ncbi:hypothetical protein F0L74_00875 [Chitinophaga agrisoli]|uniref:Microcystin-dependent protein n=1 Tax=Chitinophaga agrisoli TaxID=2607653 RepID=A0A5B2VYR3_9BACT|nr:hypothetical protein [Chitinophaga agrisoli]KAA2244561.1 hypothetical protein F0L74_00875 [Chitinophaga agrisoli]
MNKVEQLTNLGGFPMTQYTLDFMQQSYRNALAALARLAGDAVIVAGMEDTGDTVAGGWISYNGELLPFTGGPKQSTWIIEENTEDRIFADQVSRTVYFTRSARFAAGGIPYSNLQRIGTLTGMKSIIDAMNAQLSRIWKRGDVIEVDCDAAYMQANFDNTGLGINERAGWAICNGNNGTQNRGGRFAVGYDASKADYNKTGVVGGQEFVSLSVGQLPPHMHTGATQVSARGNPLLQVSITLGQGGSITGSGTKYSTDNFYMHKRVEPDPSFLTTFDTTNTGDGAAHENRPPYFVTLWIMKL